MIYELRKFVGHIAIRREFWKADDLWLAILFSGASFIWFWNDQCAIDGVRSHFPELLTLTGITFGFVLTSLFFYVQAISNWNDKTGVNRIAEKLVDWHVWTVICLLALMAYVVALWLLGAHIQNKFWSWTLLHSILVFLSIYPAFQVVNHVLTIWWVFHNRGELVVRRENSVATNPRKSGDQHDASGTNK